MTAIKLNTDPSFLEGPKNYSPKKNKINIPPSLSFSENALCKKIGELGFALLNYSQISSFKDLGNEKSSKALLNLIIDKTKEAALKGQLFAFFQNIITLNSKEIRAEKSLASLDPHGKGNTHHSIDELQVISSYADLMHCYRLETKNNNFKTIISLIKNVLGYHLVGDKELSQKGRLIKIDDHCNFVAKLVSGKMLIFSLDEVKVAGEGAHSVVVQIWEMMQRQPLAFKKVKHFEDELAQKRAMDHLDNSVFILEQINPKGAHKEILGPAITKIDIKYKELMIYGYLEPYYPKNLQQKIEEGLQPEERINFCKQVINITLILKQKDVAHLDIKPANFLCTDKNELILCDWGSSIFWKNIYCTPHLQGTTLYTHFRDFKDLTVSFLNHDQHKFMNVLKRYDPFAAGLTCYRILTLNNIFIYANNLGYFGSDSHKNLDFSNVVNIFSKRLINLVSGMTQSLPSLRLPYQEIASQWTSIDPKIDILNPVLK